MQDIIDFLRRLSENNDRDWFALHKDEYMTLKARFDDFTSQLIDRIRSFDDSIGPLLPKDCTYRIYRDTRFSTDKTPYKTHMGAFIVPDGKKSGFSGYYFQIGPESAGYDAGCMLAAGNYCCDSRVLTLLREDIANDEGAEFGAILKSARGFKLDFEGSLKRVPNGFESDKEYSKWLKLKNFCLFREPGIDYMLRPDLLHQLINDFRRTRRFIAFVNRAISYAHESDR